MAVVGPFASADDIVQVIADPTRCGVPATQTRVDAVVGALTTTKDCAPLTIKTPIICALIEYAL